jgi:hypothetical protein
MAGQLNIKKLWTIQEAQKGHIHSGKGTSLHL